MSSTNFEHKMGDSKNLETTLPSLLTLYGVEDYRSHKSNNRNRVVVREKSTKKVRNRKKTTKKEIEIDSEPEELCDHIEKMSILRDHYRRVYVEALEEKVDEQRKNIKEMQMKALKKQERHRRNLLKDKMRMLELNRLKRSKTVNDSSFTDMLPKTAYYKIVGLEQRLLREGKIKGHSQIRTFWNGMLSQPNKLEKAMGGGLVEEEIKNLVTEKRIKTNAKLFDYITIVNESDGLADLPVDEQMLSTGVPPIPELNGIRSRDSKRASNRASRRGSRRNSARQSIEKMFPKVDMPPMQSLHKRYVEKGPSPEEIQHQEEERLKLKIREKARKRISRMYLHAMANESASARKMEDSFDAIHMKCRVSDFVTEADQEAKSEQDINDTKKLPSEPLTVTEKKSNGQDNKVQDEIILAEKEEEIQMDAMESDNNLLHHKFVKSTPGTSNQKSDAEIRSQYNKRQLEPLSLNQLMQDSSVKEAQRLSSLWKTGVINNK